MWRKTLLFVGVLVLALATISPAFAQPGPKDHPGKGSGTPAAGKAEAAGAAGALYGRAFQGVIADVGTATAWKVDTDKFGQLIVDVQNAAVQWPGRKNATIASFANGDHVVIQLANKPNGSTSNLTARRVHLILGSRFIHVTGTLTSAAGSTIVVKPTDKDEVTFTVQDGTTVRNGPQVSTLISFGGTGELNRHWIGKTVTVVARDGTTKFATAIVLHGAQAGQETDVDQGKVEAEGIGISQAPGQNKDKNKDKADD